MEEKINLENIKKKVKGNWEPVDIAKIDDYRIKAYVAEGEYPDMHIHNKDKLFFVMEGDLEVIFEDHSVKLKENEGYVVKAGEKHKSKSSKNSVIMVIEHKNFMQINV